MNDIGVKVGFLGLTQYNRDLNSMEKRTVSSTNRMRRGFKDFIAEIPGLGRVISLATNPITAFGAAIAGAGLAINGFINQAAKAETTQTAFEVLVGSAERAETTLKSLRNFAASTPFQLPQIEDSARKLIAFGTSAENTTEVLRRIGNISAGVGAPLTELSEIYGKIQVQGRVFAEDINQLTGRGIPVIQELAKQFGVTSAEVRQLVTDGKVGFPQIEQAFISLTSNGGKFEGLIERLSGTYNGKLSTLRDNFAQLQRQFGEALLPIASALVDRTLALVKSLQDLQGFLYDNAEAISIASTALAAFVAPSIISGLTAIITAIRGVTLAQLSLNAAFAANPIGFVVVAVGLLATAFITLYKRSRTLRAGIAGLGAFFVELGKIIKDGFINIIDGVGVAFEGLLDLDFDKVKRGVKTAIEGVLDSNILTTGFKNGERLANAFSNGYQDKIIEEIKAQDAINKNSEESKKSANESGAKSGGAFGRAFSKAAIEGIKTNNEQFFRQNEDAILSSLFRASKNPLSGRETSIATPDNTDKTNEALTSLGFNLQYINSVFSSTNEVLAAMEGIGFRVAESLGLSSQKALEFQIGLKDLGETIKQTIAVGAANAFQSFGKEIGKAIAQGQGFGNAMQALFKGLVNTILVEVPKLIGVFLLQTGVGLGFPAGIPFVVAGIALTAFSGIASGLLSNVGANSAQSVATPNQDNITGNFSGNSINQAQGTNLGLSNFQQQSTPSNTIHIYMDGEEISQRVTSNIELENSLRGSGFN